MKRNPFLKQAFRYAGYFLLGLLLTFFVTQILIEGNSIMGAAVDKVILGESVRFRTMLPKLLQMALLVFAASFLKQYSSSCFSAYVQKGLRDVCADKIIKLEYRYFDEQGSGSIINRLISDMQEAGRFFQETLPGLAAMLVIVATVSVKMFRMDRILFFVVLLCYPVLLLTANHVSKKLQALTKTRRAQLDQRTVIAYDSIQGIVVERSYNLEDIFQKKINTVIDSVFENERMRTKISSLSFALEQIISWIPAIICYLYALYEVLRGVITVGDMMVFTILLNNIKHSVAEIPFFLNDIREISVSMDRITEIMNQPEEESGSKVPSEAEIEHAEHVIEFQGAGFAYEENTKILDGLSFQIPKGKTTALVGGSGQGKSTVFRLICGFYRIREGKYSLYEIPFSKWDIEKAREQFSLVSQNVFLLPESIAANVAYGRRSASMEEIMDACKNANIHDFIKKLPNGYDTLIGERGVRLSGGERQRISMARAFLKNAPILLLDEPTSAVDVQTENLMKEALERITKEKTVIVIAHRLNTIEHANQILVFEKGKIMESGKHQELLEKNGSYAALYGAQMQTEEKNSVKKDNFADGGGEQ